jgi:hypothetical protein
MRIRIATVAAALAMCSLITAGNAAATQTPYIPTVPIDPATPAIVQPLDCNGTTGAHGCGPGFHWRDGAHGWACYPC